MDFRQFSHQEILDNVSLYPQEFLEPFLDTLQAWADRSEHRSAPWEDYELTVREGRIYLHGVPLHSFVQSRLLKRVLGVQFGKHGFWQDNEDILEEALNRASVFPPDQNVQSLALAGEIVYLTEYPQDFGHHVDYFRIMYDEFYKTARRSGVPMAVVGYCLDPIWAHLRLAYLPGKRPHQLGVAFDSSYLFSHVTRGRASYGLFAYDSIHKTTLAMDNWWSVRTLNLRPNTRPDITGNFRERLRKGGPNLREEVRKATSELSRKRKRNARNVWRQELLSEIIKKYASRDRSRQVLIDLDARGQKSITDTAFALSSLFQHMDFERRILAEREVSKHLRYAA